LRDHVEIDEVAAEVIREAARRILADETGKITCASEAYRLVISTRRRGETRRRDLSPRHSRDEA
jgi:hypothetical protein